MKKLYYTILVGLLVPTVTNAQIRNPLQFQTIQDFFSAIIRTIITISIPIIVLLVIYAGFLFVTAGGNESQLTKAKVTILWTLVGAMVILGAFVILNVVTGTVESIRA